MREIAAGEVRAVRDARLRRRTRRRSRSRRRKASAPLDKRPVARADGVPPAAARATTSRRCASRSSATRAASGTSRRSASGRPDRRAPRRPVHRQRPGRALRPEEVRHALHPRLPARPRRSLADVSETAAPWSGLRGGLRRRDGRGARRVRPARRARATSCATSRTRTTRAPASTSRSRSCRRRRRCRSTAYGEVKAAIQQAFVDAGATLSHHHAVGTEHAQLARAGHLGARASRCCARCSTGVDPGANLNPGKITGVAEAAAERNHGEVHLDGPSRRIVAEPVARPRRRSPRPPGRSARSRRPRHGHDPSTAARPRVRSTDCGPGRSWARRGGAAGRPAAAGGLAGGGAWLDGDVPVDPGHAAPAPRLRRAASTPGTRAGARRAACSATAAAISGVVEAAGAIEVHGTASAPSARGPRALFATRQLERRAARAGWPRRYRAEVVPAGGADAVLAWCRERELGLDAAVVDELLGPEGVAAVAPRAPHQRGSGSPASRSRSRSRSSLGLEFTADPGDRPLFGRTGPVHGSP